LQDFQVLADRNLWAVVSAKPIVSDTEMAGGKQVLVILVVLKRAGLADQRIDHVTVIDRVFTAAGQTRHLLNLDSRVPYFDLLDVDHDIDLLTDQTAGNRVRIPLDLNRTAAVNFDSAHPLHVIEPARRQFTQERLLLGELVAPRQVPPLDQLTQELFVVVAAGEVAAAAQQQSLVDRRFQMTMRRLDVTVLVSFAGIDLLGLDLVVRHQVLITRAELTIFGKIVHRRAEAIRPMLARHATHFPEGVLDSAAERFERFGEADADRLPVGICQRAVVQHVIQWLTCDRHSQRVHRREIRRGQDARLMHLREDHFSLRALRAPPMPYAALERPPLRIGKRPRLLILQPSKERKRPQPRLRFQPSLNLWPDVGERVLSRPPITRRRAFRWQTFRIAILPSRLLIHTSSPCRRGEAVAAI
jgi:hypothetical protein